MSGIEHIAAREVLDSRGNPTVEVEVFLESGARGRAIVPSGASTGQFEAVELRDGDDRFDGKGVRNAVGHVAGEIAAALAGVEALDQRAVDTAMLDLDGTDNKGRLGANAILGVSLAVAKAAADELEPPVVPLRRRHQRARAARADDERRQRRRACGQQHRPAGVHDHAGRRRLVCRGAALGRGDVPLAARRLLHDRGLSTAVGDEGGFAPDLGSNEEGLQVLVQAIESAGLHAGRRHRHRARPGVDRVLRRRIGLVRARGRRATGRCRVRTWPRISTDLVDRYPIVSIEDGMAEEDWDGWRALTDALGDRVQLVGDDLFVTNVDRLSRGIDEGVANSILVKVNQIGTLSETLDTVELALVVGLHRRDVAPLGRDGGHDDRRPRGGHELRPDQGRRAGAIGPRREVQPVAAHRGDARRGRRVPRRPRRSRRGGAGS